MRIVKTLEIARTIRPGEWNDRTRNMTIEFWRGREFTFSKTIGDDLLAHRGSIWGNLFSFDMKKLCATLTCNWTPQEELACVMQIDGRYQDLTEWNEAYWNLEMETLESYLLYGDLQEQKWMTFLRRHRTASIWWCLSATLFGRKFRPTSSVSHDGSPLGGISSTPIETNNPYQPPVSNT